MLYRVWLEAVPAEYVYCASLLLGGGLGGGKGGEGGGPRLRVAAAVANPGADPHIIYTYFIYATRARSTPNHVMTMRLLDPPPPPPWMALHACMTHPRPFCPALVVLISCPSHPRYISDITIDQGSVTAVTVSAEVEGAAADTTVKFEVIDATVRQLRHCFGTVSRVILSCALTLTRAGWHALLVPMLI